MFKSLVSAAALLLTVAISGTPGGAWAAPNSSPWGADYFPNVPLVTQDGKTVMFYDDLMKDKKVLVNFIFALCDQACPLDTAKMAEVQKMLGSRVGRDVFMYSITLDPENDTPEKMKEYAAQFGAGPGWLFLTGKRADIDKIRFKFGDRGKKEEHANTVRVGKVAAGQWMRLPLAADRNLLVAEIDRALDLNWYAGKPPKRFDEAPRQKMPETGQVLFANRCASCHTFGKGAHLGPDLKGVTSRRDRDWVIRYLAAADKMRANKDPIALDLAKSWKVLMPNLALTRNDVTDLMTYIEAQDRSKPDAMQVSAPAAAGVEKSGASAHDHHQHHHGGEHK
ncbi:MAG: SCO family protein [Betaproteobacteria bacterium]|nr:SCO family protein [Betaproteobacteria bacterium]